MEESGDLHEEAGKENEQTLANLSPAEEGGVGRLLEADVQSNFVAQLSGHKNLKGSTATIQHLRSDSEKCLLSWIVSQVHPLSPK